MPRNAVHCRFVPCRCQSSGNWAKGTPTQQFHPPAVLQFYSSTYDTNTATSPHSFYCHGGNRTTRDLQSATTVQAERCPAFAQRRAIAVNTEFVMTSQRRRTSLQGGNKWPSLSGDTKGMNPYLKNSSWNCATPLVSIATVLYRTRAPCSATSGHHNIGTGGELAWPHPRDCVLSTGRVRIF
jgi:hypothetical protein